MIYAALTALASSDDTHFDFLASTNTHILLARSRPLDILQSKPRSNLMMCWIV